MMTGQCVNLFKDKKARGLLETYIQAAALEFFPYAFRYTVYGNGGKPYFTTHLKGESYMRTPFF